MAEKAQGPAQLLGLELEFIHGPYHAKHPSGSELYMNHCWKASPDYVPLMDAILTSIDCAAEAEVKTVVLHVNGDWKPPMISDIGLARFDRIVAHAVRRGVHIAFENLRTHGTLAALMERYERIPEVGFCYDCGHEHCYTEKIPYLDIFGNRTLCTHIHDNDGIHDSHTLPYYGTIDWERVMKAFAEIGYEGNLNYEAGLFVNRVPVDLRKESAKYMASVGKYLVERYWHYKNTQNTIL